MNHVLREATPALQLVGLQRVSHCAWLTFEVGGADSRQFTCGPAVSEMSQCHQGHLGTGGCGRKRTMLLGGTPGNWPLSAVLTSKRLRRKQPGTGDHLEPKGSSSVSSSVAGRKRAARPGHGSGWGKGLTSASPRTSGLSSSPSHCWAVVMSRRPWLCTARDGGPGGSAGFPHLQRPWAGRQTGHPPLPPRHGEQGSVTGHLANLLYTLKGEPGTVAPTLESPWL